MSNVVSIAIVIEKGESDTNRKIQYLVYFVNELLSDSKSLYEARLCITNHSPQAIPLLLGTPN
jgi:hypothetical protein